MIEEVGGSHVSSGTNVPPPPTEVKVRTMHSDIEGLRKMGGGLPQFKTVAVSGAESSKQKTAPVNGSGSSFPWWVVAVAAVVLAVLVWFGYSLFLKK